MHEEQDALEHALDKKTVGLVKIRMAIGLGTGSTSSLACSENISDRRRFAICITLNFRFWHPFAFVFD